MKNLFSILLLLCCSHGIAQSILVDYPYNPDLDEDNQIGVTDLMGMLGGFGEVFSPEEITIDTTDLSTYLIQMQSTMIALISEVQSLQDEISSLENMMIPGLSEYTLVDTVNHLITFSGANVQVHNGLTSSYSTNGLGNFIVGFNEESPNVELARSGSHNVVLGATNDYTGASSFITGQSNKVYASEAFVSGVNNVVSGIRSAVIGGHNNTAGGEMCVIVGGGSNTTSGSSSVVVGGNHNEGGGVEGAVLGGKLNTIDGTNTAVVGGKSNIVSGLQSAVFGGLSNEALSQQGVVFGGRYNVVHSTSNTGNGIFGGISNELFDGSIFGGSFNINRGQNNVIVGGIHNEMLQTFDEAGNGVYNRWSVIVGGDNNILPSTTSDATTVVGSLNRAYVGLMSNGSVPLEERHIQVGSIDE